MSIPNEQQIEKLLRAAPRPKAPAGLKEQLMDMAQSAPARSLKFAPNDGIAGWLRRWWPALAPATVSLACAVVLTAQQMEISDLKAGIQTLSGPAAEMEAAARRTAQSSGAASVDSAPTEAQEIARLNEEVKKLSADVSQFEGLRASNDKLRAQLAAPAANVLAPSEMADMDAMDAMEKARAKAQRIACINNLKQFGLALRIWANDNGDIFPKDIVSMSNELNNTKILICPADTAHQAAKDFSSVASANCSYNFLAPDAPMTEPERVAAYCPIHHIYLLCDGSVQSPSPESVRLIQRDGKYYMERLGPPQENGQPNLNP